jgi:thymidylate kinase
MRLINSMYQRIEFMGLPGAGKSTLYKIFLDELHSTIPNVFAKDDAVQLGIKTRDDGLIRNLAKKFPAQLWEPLCGMRNALPELHLFSSDHPELLELIFSVLAREKMSPAARQCIVYTFFQLFAEHQLISRTFSDEAFVAAEEGFVQSGSMLLGYLPSEKIPIEDIMKFVQLMPSLHALVWVDTHPVYCLSRLKRRPELPIVLQKKDDQEVMRFMTQARSCFDFLFRGLETRGISVYRVGNDDNQLELSGSEVRRIAREISGKLLPPTSRNNG